MNDCVSLNLSDESDREPEPVSEPEPEPVSEPEPDPNHVTSLVLLCLPIRMVPTGTVIYWF